MLTSDAQSDDRLSMRWSVHTLELRRETGQLHLATEVLAGLARVAMTQGDKAQAAAVVLGERRRPQGDPERVFEARTVNGNNCSNRRVPIHRLRSDAAFTDPTVSRHRRRSLHYPPLP
jgi:hypothetical protein